MIYVGIDIAKLSHYATAVDSDGVVLIEPFEFFHELLFAVYLATEVMTSDILVEDYGGIGYTCLGLLVSFKLFLEGFLCQFIQLEATVRIQGGYLKKFTSGNA